ncbi:MAG: AAA family ATPase [Panacagrimonas sp.]
MYASFFNLREMPFSITPDPAYLYMSPRHQEALGHLLFGTGQYGGFVQLTGEVGTGKTTVVRTLLEQKLEGVEVAMIHNPRQSEHEFVQSICDELAVVYDRSDTLSLKTLVDALNRHLLCTHAAGRRTVLIIDEAQNLAVNVLEQVRLLTNLETHKEKLLRIMLVGQPELSELLSRPDLRQLASRITARYHLTPLEEDETGEYLRHRLAVAGTRDELFSADAIAELYTRTRGVPRLINALADRALLGAYSRNERLVTPELVRSAAVEAFGVNSARGPATPRAAGWRRFLDRRSAGGMPLLSLSVLEASLMALALVIAGALIYQTLLRYTGRLGSATPTAAALPSPIPRSSEARRPAQPAAATAPVTLPQAPVVSAPRPPQPGGLDALFAQNLSLGQLMGRLIAVWDAGAATPRGENICRALKAQGLECYRTNGSIDDLRSMDRPAILTLTDRAGEARYALVTQLTQDRARFENTAGATVTVALSELGPVWNGDMLLLWRRETAPIHISPGQRGPAVLWLRARLAGMMGKPLEQHPSDRFDAALKDEAKQFQEARGLIADGVIGVRSRIALSDPLPGTPTLKYQP